jgi:SAM-dependent methyltransferase
MDPATSFGTAAERYDRSRPRYPEAALRWLLGDQPRRVVDLGAGTGILTRQLVALGHDVVAVDPDPVMRKRIGPGVTVIAGTAERIPLPDASVDAAVAGQSYHWFDRERAHPEIARVLRPGGVFGPLWNVRDEQAPWVAELSVRIHTTEGAGHGSGARDALDTGAELGSGLGTPERALFRHHTVQTLDTLLELVRSRSYYLTADEAGRAAIDNGVRDLVATHPDLAGRAEFTLPYVTMAYRVRRR